jgi:hypothetical protein
VSPAPSRVGPNGFFAFRLLILGPVLALLTNDCHRKSRNGRATGDSRLLTNESVTDYNVIGTWSRRSFDAYI